MDLEDMAYLVRINEAYEDITDLLAEITGVRSGEGNLGELLLVRDIIQKYSVIKDYDDLMQILLCREMESEMRARILLGKM